MGRAIAIVTGANGGLGFGICQRLLFQLSQKHVPDASPQRLVDPKFEPAEGASSSSISPFDELTLVMACRNEARALAARDRLLALFEKELARRIRSRKQNAEELAYSQKFRESLVVDFLACDLASVDSVLTFAETAKKNYPYLTHVFCNAGIGSFIGIDWPLAIKQLVTHPLDAVSKPNYKLQSTGVLSPDNLGWVWQCNILGHYLLVRNLKCSLEATPSMPARVLWTSSSSILNDTFDAEDLQIIKSTTSYEHSKRQTQLIGVRLNASTYRVASNAGTAVTQKIRHFVVHPGVVATNIMSDFLNYFSELGMLFAFYVARYLFFSEDHTIAPINGAISATHVALAPIASLPPVSSPVEYASKTNWAGRSWVEAAPIIGWDAKVDTSADEIIRKCDELCEEFEAARKI